ncbi:midasin isoform X1 [Nematostella vectensis]|uniref:midasin isoform X1 n=2 Tax=Nematostella vectensis TaxID=45351 RepID=UPI0020774EE9|nr:midasin isoform X1 [Nematostella vectensis]
MAANKENVCSWRTPTPGKLVDGENCETFRHLEKLLASAVSICRLKGSVECQTGGLITVCEELHRLLRVSISENSRLCKELKQHRESCNEDLMLLTERVRALEEENTAGQESIKCLLKKLDEFTNSNRAFNTYKKDVDDSETMESQDCSDPNLFDSSKDVQDITFESEIILTSQDNVPNESAISKKRSKKSLGKKSDQDVATVDEDGIPEKPNARAKKGATAKKIKNKDAESREEKKSKKKSSLDEKMDATLSSTNEMVMVAEKNGDCEENKAAEDTIEEFPDFMEGSPSASDKAENPKKNKNAESSISKTKENAKSNRKRSPKIQAAILQKIDSLPDTESENETFRFSKTANKSKPVVNKTSKSNQKEKTDEERLSGDKDKDVVQVNPTIPKPKSSKKPTTSTKRQSTSTETQSTSAEGQSTSTYGQSTSTEEQSTSVEGQSTSTKSPTCKDSPKANKKDNEVEEEDHLGDMSFLIDISSKLSTFVSDPIEDSLELPLMSAKERNDVYKLAGLFNLHARSGTKEDSRSTLWIRKQPSTKMPRLGKIDELLSKLMIAASKEAERGSPKLRSKRKNADNPAGANSKAKKAK